MNAEYKEIEEQLAEKYFLIKQKAFYFFLGGLIATIASGGFLGYELMKKAAKDAVASTTANAANAEVESLRRKAGERVTEIEAAVAKIETATRRVSSSGSVTDRLDALDKRVDLLARSTQEAFNLVGAKLGENYHDITLLQEMLKKPTPTAKPRVTSDTGSLSEGTYIVKAGDSPSKIARSLGLNLADLQRMNPNVEWMKLKVGQKIVVSDTNSGKQSSGPTSSSTSPSPEQDTRRP